MADESIGGKSQSRVRLMCINTCGEALKQESEVRLGQCAGVVR